MSSRRSTPRPSAALDSMPAIASSHMSPAGKQAREIGMAPGILVGFGAGFGAFMVWAG
jgi:hypothetical protein